MANNDNVSVTLVSQPFILSFPEIVEPKAYKPKGATEPKGGPEYSFEAISEPDDLTAWDIFDQEKGDFIKGDVQKRIVKLAREKWGADYNVVDAVKTKDLGWPFKSGDQKADDKGSKAEHYRGKKSWRAHAKPVINGRINKPSLYESVDGGKLIKLMRSTEAGKARIDELFYGGAICTAEVSAVALETPQGKFVTLYFNSLVFERDGERLGGGSKIEKLRGVEGGSTDYDPTKNMGDGADSLDDEIPFD